MVGFNARAMGFSAQMMNHNEAAEFEANGDKPSTTALIEKFMHMYQELESRLERGI